MLSLTLFFFLWVCFLLKVYTCVSESVIAEFVPFSTPKFRYYDKEILDAHYAPLNGELKIIEDKVNVFL